MRALIFGLAAACAARAARVTSIYIVVERVFDAFLHLIAHLIDATPLAGLFNQPLLAFAGPTDTPIAGALFQRNRHEAGLARLGAVRHR